MAVELWTINQVADFFKERGMVDLNKKWVQRRCDDGYLPYTLVNNRRRIRRAVVETMFDKWVAEAT